MTPLLLAFGVVFACGALFGVCIYALLISAGDYDGVPYDEDWQDSQEALRRHQR